MTDAFAWVIAAYGQTMVCYDTEGVEQGGGIQRALGLLLMGLGCAPIYPCVIHSTPAHFGAENSQAIIGVQMASAYVGICLMPPLYGIVSSLVGPWLLPFYLIAINVLMILMCERLNKKCAAV